jgi:hypothetical protein
MVGTQKLDKRSAMVLKTNEKRHWEAVPPGAEGKMRGRLNPG